MRIGYNTNGFGFHRLDDALRIIAEAGYQAVALTPDVHHLDPFRATSAEVRAIGLLIRRLGLSCVIETGARFVLDADRKHRPTLLDDDPWPRMHFMRRCFEIADELGASVVGAWSGARPEAQVGMPTSTDDQHYSRLAHHWHTLSQDAADRGLTLSIEPEPGFLIERMADYDRLCVLLGYAVPLTVDIGHVVCVGDGGEGPIEDAPARIIRKYRDAVVNVQLDDMNPGDHTHLMFGKGMVDLSATFAALREINYPGAACVELSDGSRNAVSTCQEAMQAIRTAQR